MSFLSPGRIRISRSATNLSLRRSRSSSNIKCNNSNVDICPTNPKAMSDHEVRMSYSSSDASSIFTCSTSTTSTTTSSTRSIVSFLKDPRGGRSKLSDIPSSTTPTLWYDERRLEETVTEEFLFTVLGDSPNLRKRLQQPLMDCSSSLTDTTFSQWILSKCRKLFMALYEVGAAERIFDLVESSLDDGDLPIDMADISRLGFNDKNTEKRFWKKQYCFVAREIEKGNHMVYLDEEVVPIESVRGFSGGAGGYGLKKQPSSFGVTSGKFIFPRSQLTVTRKSVRLDVSMSERHYMREIQRLKDLSHPHIVSIFASYTQSNVGYVLFSPSPSMTLRSFMAGPTPAYKMLPYDGKRRQIFDWMNCLSDAAAFLYDKGVVHGEICPKNILVEGGGIFLADIGTSRRFDCSTTFDEEYPNYEYCAPEAYKRKLPPNTPGRSASTSSPLPSTEAQSTADLFSLSCVFIELLTFLQNMRTLKQFVSHRGLRNRRGARGARGALADQSYHSNLEQVRSWISMLCKSSENDGSFVEACRICGDVLFQAPLSRPQPQSVRDAFFKLAKGECSPNVPHCGGEKSSKYSGGWSSPRNERTEFPWT